MVLCCTGENKTVEEKRRTSRERKTKKEMEMEIQVECLLCPKVIEQLNSVWEWMHFPLQLP